VPAFQPCGEQDKAPHLCSYGVRWVADAAPARPPAPRAGLGMRTSTRDATHEARPSATC